MDQINWKVRIRNKSFWLFIIPLAFLLVQQVLAIFGVITDFTNLENQVIAIVGTVFAILAGLGIVVDPTTPGIVDSPLAQSYDEPGVNYDLFDDDVSDDMEDDGEIEE